MNPFFYMNWKPREKLRAWDGQNATLLLGTKIVGSENANVKNTTSKRVQKTRTWAS